MSTIEAIEADIRISAEWRLEASNNKKFPEWLRKAHAHNYHGLMCALEIIESHKKGQV